MFCYDWNFEHNFTKNWKKRVIFKLRPSYGFNNFCQYNLGQINLLIRTLGRRKYFRFLQKFRTIVNLISKKIHKNIG